MAPQPASTFIAEAGFTEIKRVRRMLQDRGVETFIVRPEDCGNT